MEREFLERQGLNADQIKAVMAQAGKETNALREDYDQKVASLNEKAEGYKSQLADRDQQLEDLKSVAKDNDELKSKLTDISDANKEKDKEWEAKFAEQAKDFAIDKFLTKAGSKNNTAVRALIDESKISVADDGKLIGAQEVLDPVIKENPYLFKEEAPKEEKKTPTPHVFSPGDNASDVDSKKPSDMSLEDQMDLYQNDKSKWRKLFEK